MNMVHSGLLECEILTILHVVGSKISRLPKVLTNGINNLHTRHPLCVLAHAILVVDLVVIEANALTWEVEDGCPCAHRCPKQYPIDSKATFSSTMNTTRPRLKPPMTVATFYLIHAGSNLFTCYFLAFVCLEVPRTYVM